MKTFLQPIFIVLSIFPAFCIAQSAANESGNLKDPVKSGQEIDSNVYKFNLYLENFDWTAPPKTEPAKEEKKTETNTGGSSSTGFNFDNFDWLTATSSAAKTVSIGTQAWAGANLDVSAFRNGDAINEAKTDSDWEVAYYNKKPAWCYYGFDAANAKYGKLYNIYAVTDSRGLAPSGWHIPSKDEWQKLFAAAPADGAKLRGAGEGNYGFVQGGYRSANDFMSINVLGVWWSSTKKTMYGAYASSANDGAYGVSLNVAHNQFYGGDYSSSQGLSVRCIKD